MRNTVIPTLLVLLGLVACSAAGIEGTVSECGGFNQGTAQALTEADAPDYCAAEVILWRYDSATEKLSVSNERVLLNCCGDHSVQIQQMADKTYTISEVDAPESGNSRCMCMCAFDFRVTGEAIPESTITLKLERTVTDNDKPFSEVFSGQIDLSQGSGRIPVDTTDIGPWCGEIE